MKLAPAEAEALWQHQYQAAAQKSEKGLGGKGGWRVRELVLIGGLVLPIWGLVEQALVKQQRPIDRRMHVLRLQTTGDPPAEPLLPPAALVLLSSPVAVYCTVCDISTQRLCAAPSLAEPSSVMLYYANWTCT